MTTLDEQFSADPFQAYSYGYPHKTAYRQFDTPLPLDELWNEERHRRPSFLYVHIPFCEMRCGFCNLFTSANPEGDFTRTYLEALTRQAETVRSAIGKCGFERLAIGGGTPTFLNPDQLDGLFDMLAGCFDIQTSEIPASIETSPKTADFERLRVLAERKVERISIGIQSFREEETNRIGRPQSGSTARQALERIRTFPFRILNIDLMYGLPGQTPESWRETVREALCFEPEELFIYPLYVRPLTGLGRKGISAEDEFRLNLYRAARDLLLSSGYEQFSMRKFHKSKNGNERRASYCCQDEGMVGIGCGARSYSRAVHYADDFAVDARRVRAIIENYTARESSEFGFARHGFRLDAVEQRRRFLILSLLNADGLSVTQYETRFGRHPVEEWPELLELAQAGLFRICDEHILPTDLGLELSDAIGTWFYSPAVRELMEGYEGG